MGSIWKASSAGSALVPPVRASHASHPADEHSSTEQCTCCARASTARRASARGCGCLRAGADAAGLCAFEPRRRGFGGMVSDDLRRWTDVSESFDVPEGYKHGAAIALSREALNAVCLPSAAAGGVGEAGAASVRVASSELCRGVT